MIHDRRTDPRVGRLAGGAGRQPVGRRSDERHGRHDPAVEARLRQAGQAAASAGRRAGPDRVARPARLARRPAQDDFALVPADAGQDVRAEARAGRGAGLQRIALRSRCSTIIEPGESTANVAGCWPDCATRWCRWWPRLPTAAERPTSSILSRHYPEARASSGSAATVAARIGFDFGRGRLDVTAHPFCTSLGPARLPDHHPLRRTLFSDRASSAFCTRRGTASTTRDCGPSGTACRRARPISLGIHESQSRLWENLVGRSRAVLAAFLPGGPGGVSRGAGDVSLDDFYFAINDVRPSLIRVEADEATYNLHILIRFELEQALLSDDLPVADLPAAWNEKYQRSIWASRRPTMPTACCKTFIGPPGWSATFRPIRWAISTPRSSSPRPIAELGGLAAAVRRRRVCRAAHVAGRKDSLARPAVHGRRVGRARDRQAAFAPAADGTLARQTWRRCMDCRNRSAVRAACATPKTSGSADFPACQRRRPTFFALIRRTANGATL